MKGRLIIPVEYKGEQLELKGKILEVKFGFRFKVKVGDGEVIIEPDKEGKYKVAVRPARLLKVGKIDVDLVEKIREVVGQALKT